MVIFLHEHAITLWSFCNEFKRTRKHGLVTAVCDYVLAVIQIIVFADLPTIFIGDKEKYCPETISARVRVLTIFRRFRRLDPSIMAVSYHIIISPSKIFRVRPSERLILQFHRPRRPRLAATQMLR